MPHAPQFAGCVGSTHAPAQFRGVEPSASQPTVHPPFVHVPVPAPASGPTHEFPQLPQFAGSVGSTHVPLHSSVVGALQPASPDASAAPPASVCTTMTTAGEPSRDASVPPSDAGADGENAVDPQRHRTNVAATQVKTKPYERFIALDEDYYSDTRAAIADGATRRLCRRQKDCVATFRPGAP